MSPSACCLALELLGSFSRNESEEHGDRWAELGSLHPRSYCSAWDSSGSNEVGWAFLVLVNETECHLSCCSRAFLQCCFLLTSRSFCLKQILFTILEPQLVLLHMLLVSYKPFPEIACFLRGVRWQKGMLNTENCLLWGFK